MKRPTFLTVWLTLLTLATVSSLFSTLFNAGKITTVFPNLPAWMFPVSYLQFAITFICIVLLWRWKKIGFYVLVANTIVTAVLNIALLGSLGIITVFFGLIEMSILYLAMRPVWQQFT